MDTRTSPKIQLSLPLALTFSMPQNSFASCLSAHHSHYLPCLSSWACSPCFHPPMLAWDCLMRCLERRWIRVSVQALSLLIQGSKSPKQAHTVSDEHEPELARSSYFQGFLDKAILPHCSVGMRWTSARRRGSAPQGPSCAAEQLHRSCLSCSCRSR